MSMPAPQRLAVSRRVALATVLGATAALTGCQNHEAIDPYQPAAGVETTVPEVLAVRNLMFVVDEGTKGTLHGTIIADEGDKLVDVKGYSLKTDNSEDQPLTLSLANVELPAGKPVNLADEKVTVDGVTAGGLTRLTINFEKTKPVTLTVPVVDKKSTSVHEG